MQHRLYDCERETDLALVWQLLQKGRLFLSSSYCSEGRCFAWLETGAGNSLASQQHLSVLERVFQGESQKALACELGVSAATVAGYCKVALGAVTQLRWVTRAPIVLVMAALASDSHPVGRARLDSQPDHQRFLVSVEVPGQSFRDRLTASEWQVARLSIEGETHASVARLRGTSERTVANQLASVFAKLKVSGRSELRAKAVHEYAERQQTLPPMASLAAPVLSHKQLQAASWRQAPLDMASSA
jgi:DNA-binding NarL/FixJ family response regulator